MKGRRYAMTDRPSIGHIKRRAKAAAKMLWQVQRRYGADFWKMDNRTIERELRMKSWRRL